MGQPEQALALNTQALAQLVNDTKLSLQFQADRVWMLAALGRAEEAAGLAAQVKARMPELATSRGSQTGCLRSLGRAFAASGDWTKSLDCWERYLALAPDPVDIPRAYYNLGVARQGLGEMDRATECFQQASSAGVDTFQTRLAARQLATNKAEME